MVDSHPVMCIFMARQGSSIAEIRQTVSNRFNYDLSLTLDEIRPRYSWHGLDGVIDGGTCQGSVPQANIFPFKHKGNSGFYKLRINRLTAPGRNLHTHKVVFLPMSLPSW